MKHKLINGATAVVLLLLLFTTPGRAQTRPPLFNQNFNPYHTDFQLLNWQINVPNDTRLIEIGPLLDNQRNNLLLLIGQQNSNDFRRKLLVTHWDGFQFATDTSFDFTGWATDPMLIGQFHEVIPANSTPTSTNPTPTSNANPAPDDKKKKKATKPTRQLVVAGGVYAWSGGAFTRVGNAPPDLKLALRLPSLSDQMVVHSGDSAAVYELGDKDIQPSSYLFNPVDEGYPCWGIGTQQFNGVKDYLPGIRYIQTFWKDRARWQICLERGKPANLTNQPDATINDRLIVYVPKYSNRNKTYWQLIHTDDYEEAWRSGPLPGRVLDVRVGDVINAGKIGILVLTAENGDKERHLYFYTPTAIQVSMR